MLSTLGRLAATAAGVAATGATLYFGAQQFLADSEVLAAGIQAETQKLTVGQAV